MAATDAHHGRGRPAPLWVIGACNRDTARWLPER
jgi:hypothetical protein